MSLLQLDTLLHVSTPLTPSSLPTLGLLPGRSMGLPSLQKAIDRHRLSGFLYNISMYLQEMGTEMDEPGRVPPRPSVRLQDWFLSLRGSPHWDGLLGLLQNLLSLFEWQPHRPLLDFLSQNWRTVSALLEVALQALVSGTYGQASAGLQGFICALRGHSDCAFSVSWLTQLLRYLETRNWKPVVNLHPAGQGADQRVGSGAFGRLKPFSLAEQNPTLLQGLDGLRRGLLHRVGSSVYGNLKRKVSRVTMALLDDVSSAVPQANHKGRCSIGDLRQLILWGIRHNVTWNAQALGFNSQGPPSTPSFLTCTSTEGKRGDPRSPRPARRGRKKKPSSPAPVRPACNASIPGLTGVSNFTVFLYCNLFEGEDGLMDPEMGQVGADLHATCSDAAWYLSAAEDDFLWVHVCSEFFAHEFNNTVCANSSFWLERLSVVEDGSSPGPGEACLTRLGTRSLSAHDFRRCFMPNSSTLVTSLCGAESPGTHASRSSLPESSWAAEYCSRLRNSSRPDRATDTCDYRKWTLPYFTNATLLELCGSTEGLREYVCRNAALHRRLLPAYPRLSDICVDLEMEQEDRKCFLQWFFDMLPAPYNFDTSQLCASPAPLLAEALSKLSACELEGDEPGGWVGAVGYVLRMLDFVVGLSAGLDEGEGEVRQGLGQAILLSSLLDNASFWATLRPDASLSVLHTVGVFLRREQNAALKEDLLSCFSVRYKIYKTRAYACART
uniref:Stereocilin LRR domain-containing protein n=1 Tax=Esox lucius TaxID=8010 RepID=A0A3P8ZWJ5_ESOLU